MIACKDVLKQVVDLLVAADVPDADLDAWYLFEHVTGMNRSAYFLHQEDNMIQEQAEQRLDNLTEKLMQSQGVTEQLKATNPLVWTRKMNMIYQQAEEVILQELVYQ